MSWIAYGLRRGILTTKYPAGPDAMPPAYRGAAVVVESAPGGRDVDPAICLSGAISRDEAGARVNMRRCFQCGECARRYPATFAMENDFELAEVGGIVERTRERLALRARAWGRSVHVRHVDAGSDGSEEQELLAIFNPFYDANRLGIFLTASPRHADLLLVTGVVTGAMEAPLRATYDAMPEPKTVVALGTSACSGAIFAGAAGIAAVSDVVPVNVFVPGSPPPPLTILHALWVALGRADARKGRT